ncbi:radical SAM family protein [Mesorhizobium loti]|uniref:Radical SAM family protein n=1 Tax=Rhizobium loti TaxID=381 RepID=A0A8E2WAF4_RHILI|nr:radical SAM protein [Mesorhizobium loti]PWJ88379.1 radical SAM family protein [Mesorhizobium loti]
MNANDATLRNLARKATFVDRVQMVGKVPLFSFVEINPTELCNRACVFCPRVDDAIYPNQRLHMSVELARKIAADLKDLAYEGTVHICGFGEPLLHPKIIDLVRAFGEFRVELTTNGDRLTASMVRDLTAAGCDYICVSMYDGPSQIEHFEAIFAEAGSSEFILRDRWQPEEENFGLSHLTNRAGTINVGEQRPIDATRPCWYAGYQLMLDWNGDVLLCPQDWHKVVRFGSAAHEHLLDIWTSPAMRKRRMQLLRSREGLSPCGGCNSDGCKHGVEHAAAWQAR